MMIEINNVSKTFVKKISRKESQEFLADDNISLTANLGEVVGILGPNGAGKTTLLRMMSGIMTPDKGTIKIDGKTYKENAEEIKRKISYLSGNTKLYKDISAYELFKMCCDYYKVDKTIVETRIKEIAKRFSIEDLLHQKIGNLSTGQLQRVNIARCILHNPDYYIFDEATSGLDIISSKVILDFIKEERKNKKCIIYSTHYMEEAENICNRVILIHKGKIIKEGSPKDIIKETQTTNLRDAFFALIGGVSNE